MANIKSAIKRIKVSARQAERNKSQKSSMKSLYNKALEAIEEGSEEAEKCYRDATAALDKSARKNIIHKNAAARKKSQLTKAYNNMNQ